MTQLTKLFFSNTTKQSLSFLTMKRQQWQPQLQLLFYLFLLIATVSSSSSPLDPKQLKALKSLKILTTTTKDPCNSNDNNNSSSSTITCDNASPFRHVTSLSFKNCSSSLSLPYRTLKPLSESLLSLSFHNCPSLSPPKHLPISLHSFTAVSSFHHRNGLSGVYLARLVNLTNLNISSIPISTSGLYVILGNMRKVTSLTISNSRLSGNIPKSFHSNLTYIDLSKNLLKGTIRTSVSLLELTHLDLSGNQLNGTVPSFLSEIKSLKHLNLADNSFHGVLPFNASFIKNLDFFEVRGNSGLCYNHTVVSSKLNLGIAPCDKYGLPLSSQPQKEDSTSDDEEEEEDDYDDDYEGGNENEKEEQHGSNKIVLGVAIGLSSLVFLIIFLILLARWCG